MAFDVMLKMEASPYSPPRSELNSEETELRKKGRWVALAGIVLFTGPIWGLLGTIIGMTRAFNTLGDSDSATPEALAENISTALVTTAIGISVGLLGVILILTALFGVKNRERWFYRWTIGLSIFWCVTTFPFGLIIGLPIIIMLRARRAEFSNLQMHNKSENPTADRL